MHRYFYIALLIAAQALLLSGCTSSHTVRVVDMTPPRQAETTLTESQLLDVGVSIFDENVPDNYDERIEQIIMPEVAPGRIPIHPLLLEKHAPIDR